MEGRTVLYLGDQQHEELRDAVRWLQSHARCRFAESAGQAMTMLASGFSPSLILLAVPRRGCFATDQIERIRRAEPLAPIVALLGSWCEGETRSGSPWSGVQRIAWHQWRHHLPGLVRAEHSQQTASLPRTATLAEASLFQASRPVPTRSGLVLIHTPSFAAFDALADVCLAAGYSVGWQTPAQPVVARGAIGALWDGDGCGPDEADAIRQLNHRVGGAPILVLLNFPRRDDVDRALAAGAATVLAKPLWVNDLWSDLETLSRSGAATRRAG